MRTHAITFDEKNKSAEISHLDLAKTIELGDAMGDLPKQCPVQPGVLINTIVENVKKFANMEAIVSPIVIREPYCQLNRKKIKDGQNLDFEDYLVRRMVTRIDLPLVGFENTENRMNASIAMTYIYTDNQKGIQIAFGENVNVCENLSTFGGYNFSTYGSSKVGFEDGIELMNHWLQNINVVHDKHLLLIEDLMNTQVKSLEFQRIIGSLFEKAVRFNSGESISAPLSQSEISAMVQKGLPVLKEDKDYLTGWEIMNWGTAVLKPHTSDMTHLIPDLADFNTFLCNEFGVKMDLAI